MEKLIERFKGLSFFMKIAVIAGILFVGSAVIAGIYESIVGPEETENPIEEIKEDEPAENVEEPNEDEPEEVEDEQEEIEGEPTIVEHEEQFLFGEFTVESFKTEIIDNELELSFYWINQSGKDDIPFISVGYFDVLQGEEILKDTSGAYDPGTNSDALRKTDNGIMSPIRVTYDLVNDDPIEVRFGATHENDDTKETLTIELN